MAGLRSALVRTADVSASESTLNVKPADVVKVFCLVKQQGFVFQSFSLNFNINFKKMVYCRITLGVYFYYCYTL